jgi:hypothetical protein
MLTQIERKGKYRYPRAGQSYLRDFKGTAKFVIKVIGYRKTIFEPSHPRRSKERRKSDVYNHF